MLELYAVPDQAACPLDEGEFFCKTVCDTGRREEAGAPQSTAVNDQNAVWNGETWTGVTRAVEFF